jgi:type I restriction enzyme R subunit
VEIEFKDETTGEIRGGRARLIDLENPAANDYLIVRQLAIQGPGKSIRPDLILYVNGLPLALVELKNPSTESADVWSAIDQLARYQQLAPDLFIPNLLLVATDGLLTRVGSITSTHPSCHTTPTSPPLPPNYRYTLACPSVFSVFSCSVLLRPALNSRST